MKIFGYTLAQVKKALFAFFTPGVVALGVAVSTESPGGSTITTAEWVGIAVAMLGTGGLVFAAKNASAELDPVKQP